MTADTDYSVPGVATETFVELLNDPRLAIPDAVKEAAKKVSFDGTAVPFLCVPSKFAEAIAAVKGLEAAFAGAIAQQRFNVDAGQVVIDTDHAALFVFSAFSTTLNGKPSLDRAASAHLRDTDIHDSGKHRYRQMATNIYKTKDGRYFHLHGSMNARPSMTMVGVDPERTEITDAEEIRKIYGDAVAKWNAEDIDKAANEEYRQAGTICYTWDEFKQLEQGMAIINCPIYELSEVAPTPPVAWPPATKQMALSGIKVLELTRVIAGPAVGKGLAEHGATVLRITSSTLPDLGILNPDLSQGKYNADLNLKTPEGKRILAELIKDADVFIDGYRPGCVAGLGFGREQVRKLNPNIIHVRENCYGWHGPWQGRSGWQQVSDCLTGLSRVFGESLGLDEPVVPIFPNSDFGAGASGLVGAMHALYLRATKGGVFDLDLSLSYYNVFLMGLGTYPDEVYAKVKTKVPLRHDWDMTTSLPIVIPELVVARPDVFMSPKFWHTLDAPALSGKIRTVAPVIKFSGPIEVIVQRGPVQNGDDPAEWPKA